MAEESSGSKLTSKSTLPLHDRVAIVAVLIALALFASFALSWSTREVTLGGLSFTLSGKSLLGLIAMGLACTGADAIARSQRKVRREGLLSAFLRCILPTAATAAAWVLLAQLPNVESRAVGIAAHAAALALIIAVEYHAADPVAAWRGAVKDVLQLVVYAVSALLYGAIHLAPDANVARAGLVASAFMALRLLGEEGLPTGRVLGTSLGIGLLLGALSGLLHTRIASAVTYSLTLVILLYVLTGLARQALWGKLRREVVLEYALVGLAALVVLSFFAR